MWRPACTQHVGPCTAMRRGGSSPLLDSVVQHITRNQIVRVTVYRSPTQDAYQTRVLIAKEGMRKKKLTIRFRLPGCLEGCLSPESELCLWTNRLKMKCVLLAPSRGHGWGGFISQPSHFCLFRLLAFQLGRLHSSCATAFLSFSFLATHKDSIPFALEA